MIVYEILDKFTDIATAVVYYRGRFESRKESVYEALLAFTIIGGIISAVRISLYIWRIHLNRKNDESRDKVYDNLDLGVISVKVVLEAFPQSLIANFFVHCPIKKYGWGTKILDPTFDAFSGMPFIIFWISLRCYCCKYPFKCDDEPARKKAYILPIAMSFTFVVSVVGIVFAGLSLGEFANRCS